LFEAPFRIEGPERYKAMTLATHEFIRRFLIHVLPAGFHRIRYYGLLASGKRGENIVRARELPAHPSFDRFWNELSANPRAIGEATRRHYAKLYARPDAMHSAFNQFAAFTQDAIDNKAFASRGKLKMPVLAIGADKSFGAAMADELRYVASDVSSVVIRSSGHWLMEEQPAATVAAILAFLDNK